MAVSSCSQAAVDTEAERTAVDRTRADRTRVVRTRPEVVGRSTAVAAADK